MRMVGFFERARASISYRLTGRVLAAAVIVGSLLSAGQIVADVVRENDRARTTLTHLVASITPLAAKAAYELNSQAAEDVLAGLQALSPILSARIESDSGAFLAAMERPPAAPSYLGVSEWLFADWRKIEIVLLHENVAGPVGRLTIAVDTALLGEGLVRRAWTTIVAGLLRNILLAVVFIYIFHRFLARPLARLCEAFQDVDVSRRAPMRLARPDNHDGDELGGLTDVINEHLAARALAEEQLFRSQRMQSIGQLTGGIAHDFNNILGVIIGNLELAKMRASKDDAIYGLLESAEKGADRAAALTRKLLDFSRKEDAAVRRVDVSEAIRMMDGLIDKLSAGRVETAFRLEAPIWPVDVDLGDLQDAVINLALNARDAMPSGGRMTIETANKTLDQDYALKTPEAKAGDYVMISVGDTGAGMSQEILDRAFEPFFTTKAQGSGTGLGLSMVYGFVERSGGHIKLYSEPGAGTTVRVYLPRAGEAVEREGVMPPRQTLPRGAETVLIVDDETELLQVAAIYLEGLGYTVMTARDGDAALAALRGAADIRLMFSDVIMPGGLDGYQLAAIARSENPSLRILLASGFVGARGAADPEHSELFGELNASLLHKPYNQRELAVAVREALDDEGAPPQSGRR